MNNNLSINDAIELRNTGKTEEAARLLLQLIDENKESDKAYYHLALIATEAGEHEKAIQHYEAALKANPHYHKAANNLGLLYQQQENYGLAYHLFGIAHQEVPGDIQPICNMALAAYGLRDFQTALKHLQQARKMEAFSTLHLAQQQELLLLDADCHLQLHQAEKAEQQYEEVSRHKTPSQLKAFNQLAFIALEIKHDPTAADRWIDQALAIDASFKPSVQNKGLILKATGKFAEALPYLEKVIRLDPDGFEGYYNLACLYCAQQQEQEARKAVEKALQLAPFIKGHLRHDKDFAPYFQSDWFRKLVQ